MKTKNLASKLLVTALLATTAMLATQKPAHADFAYGTRVAINDGAQAPIETLERGDLVRTFDDRSKPSHLVPSQANIFFSSGAQGTYAMAMITIADGRILITSFDQVLVLSDGSLKRAKNLKPGDFLLQADGRSARVDGMNSGLFKGGIHSIATDAPKDSVQGHIIVAEGLLVGDYRLQLNPNI